METGSKKRAASFLSMLKFNIHEITARQKRVSKNEVLQRSLILRSAGAAQKFRHVYHIIHFFESVLLDLQVITDTFVNEDQ